MSAGVAGTECQTLGAALSVPGRKGRGGISRGDAGAEGCRRRAAQELPLSGRAELWHEGNTHPGPDVRKEPAERALVSRPGLERAPSQERSRHHEQRGRLQLQAGGNTTEIQLLLPAAWDPSTLEQALVATEMDRDGHLQGPGTGRRPR